MKEVGEFVNLDTVFVVYYFYISWQIQLLGFDSEELISSKNVLENATTVYLIGRHWNKILTKSIVVTHFGSFLGLKGIQTKVTD